MSMQKQITVTCPKCGGEHQHMIWHSINTQLDPEMKEAVKDRSAFLFECPSCGERTYIDHSFLYHQMEDSIMIYYVNSDSDFERACEALTNDTTSGIFDETLDGSYTVRVVRSFNDLLEKINIFDDGLDDRIIEIIKVYVLATFQNENPGCKAVKEYYVRDGDKQYIQIIADGELRGAAEIPEGLYDKLVGRYSDKLSVYGNDISGELCVDRRWAFDIMGLKG